MSIEFPPQAWPVHEVQLIRSVDGALGKSSLAPFILGPFYSFIAFIAGTGCHGQVVGQGIINIAN